MKCVLLLNWTKIKGNWMTNWKWQTSTSFVLGQNTFICNPRSDLWLLFVKLRLSIKWWRFLEGYPEVNPPVNLQPFKHPPQTLHCFHQRDGGVTGVQTEGSRPCGDESYWATSCTSVAALLSYIGEPAEGAVAELVRPWWWAPEPRRNWEPKLFSVPPFWDAAVMGELLTDHRLVYWLHGKTERKRVHHKFMGQIRNVTQVQ